MSGAPRFAAVAGAGGALGALVSQTLTDAGWTVIGYDATGVGDARGVIELDVLDRGAVAEAVSAIDGDSGTLDALVLLPPTLPATPVAEIAIEDWHAALRSQLLVAANFAWAVLPTMVARGGGNIVAVASDAALGAPGGVLAAAASGTVVGFAKALAIEIAKTGVQVNAVCAPGDLERPGDIADTVLYLAGEMHFFLGQVIHLNGRPT